MNKRRRERLSGVSIDLSKARDIIEGVLDEESEAYDNLPEVLRYSDRGEKMGEAVETLENAVYGIDSIIEQFRDITS
jgi:hypothetical protein